MQSYKKLLIALVLTFGSSSVFANNIEVATFDELINSHPLSGDTIQIINNLTSTSTIGGNFLGININFDGQNFLMNGENAYGGFLLDKDSVFSQIKMTNFKGQLESGTSSYYAGAIYNEGGAIDVNNSYFANNYADSERINFGAGGAIYNMQNSTMNINSTVFENNYADGGSSYGGAIANGKPASGIANMTIQNSIFKNNYAISSSGSNGGAIYNNGNIKIYSSQFENNSAQVTEGSTASGGAIYNSGTALIDGSAFIGNGSISTTFTTTSGGVIFNNNSLTITNSTFNNNDNSSEDTSLIAGGTIYNEGTTNIQNTSFSSNKTNGTKDVDIIGGIINNRFNTSVLNVENSTFVQNEILTGNGENVDGAVIFNNGSGTIKNSVISNNYADGGSLGNIKGGAIYNSLNLLIESSEISDNFVDSGLISEGGAIYNNTNGTITILNSNIENNKVSSSTQSGNGGGIYNLGTLIIENSNLENNYSVNGKLNDIYNENGTITIKGDGTTNILSGIEGSGTVNKNGAGVLNLGGINENYTGDFNFEEGTINLLKNASYFSATGTVLGDSVNFNMQNGQINNINYGNLTLNGQSNLFADANLQNKIMDTISASSINGGGNLFVKNILIEGVPEGEKITIPFANSTLKNYVSYQNKTIETPIYNYFSSYDNQSGDFNFTKEGFNPSILASPIAAQLGGYLVSLETYKNVFSNLDMVMIENNLKEGFSFKNKIASVNNFTFSPLLIPEERKGIWFKPYSVFENVPIKNGPDVSNVMYGGIVGGESNLIKLKNNWYSLYGVYFGYNGSHQAYSRNDIYNNGGLIGLTGAIYKKNFFSILTANVGANSAKAHTSFGSDNFNMLNTGLAQKTGFNFPILNNRLILQPSIIASYTFINTFNFTTTSNVHINAKPINALHIEPSFKLIGNFKDYLEPYLAVSFAWNLIDKAKFQANDVYLPSLSIKPYVQYGFGVQKRFKDRVTAFFEGMIRNGGRNGIALVLGIRISI